MDGWTSQALSNATPEQVLEVLTHPGQIRRWSPIEFDAENLDCRPLAAGTRTKVSGRVAGVPVSFDVEVHAADQDRLGSPLRDRSAWTFATTSRPPTAAPR